VTFHARQRRETLSRDRAEINKMAMNADERRQIKAMLERDFIEVSKSDPANMAIFYDDNDKMMYSGIIEKWPVIVAVDIEWGKVKQMDTSKEPYFTGKKVRFFSRREWEIAATTN
jgi:hypothetical protein